MRREGRQRAARTTVAAALALAGLASLAAADDLLILPPRAGEIESSERAGAEDPAAEPAPNFATLVRDLDDPDFAVRERAATGLRAWRGPDDDVFQALFAGRLTAEQRHRLLSVLAFRYVHRPRGALGVSMRSDNVTEVIVTSLVAGLPAEKVLEPGDRITHLDGHEFANRTEFDQLIKAKWPGDLMTVTVRRLAQPGEPAVMHGDRREEPEARTFEIELGSLDELSEDAGELHARRMRSMLEMTIQNTVPPPKDAIVPPDALERASITSLGDVDDHPYVRQIQRELRLIDAGRLTLDAELHAEWQERLRDLYALQRTSETPEARDFVGRVIMRLRELMR